MNESSGKKRPGKGAEPQKPSGVSETGGKQLVMEVRDLSKSFSSGDEILDILSRIDLELVKGRSMAIVGASGSGKSTLLYILGGLDRPSRGEVWSGGKNIFGLTDTERAHWRSREVGFVFQFHHLLAEFDALENVAMPARLAGLTRPEAEALAEPLLVRVGLGERLRHRPGTLSGGEQQRVALARSLVMSPSILLADEPTGNLDGKNAALVNDLICQLVEEDELTAVVVTHNTELARRLDDCLELTGGLLGELAS